MKRYRFTGIILAFLLVACRAWPLFGESAVVPGDINQISVYTNFFYNYPSEDFFYYLNDRLLFMEKPDGKIEGSGLRNKLLKIVRWHKVIKKSLQRVKRDKNNMVTIDVADDDGYKKASVILNLMGIRITKLPGGQYRLALNPASGGSGYFRFTLIRAKTMERILNKTHHLHLKLKESEIPIPWDYEFLREITGLEIDSTSFFEMMLKNEQFSLLLGILYRLSYKEINHISNLVKIPRFDAWKQIYKERKFLMGMFLLSDGLRVTDGEEGQWALPGGTDAEAFWCHLAGKDYKQSPLEFLHSLATKDEGKLNYLYLFSVFLRPGAQKALFSGTNAQKLQEIYHLVSLTDKEKLNEFQFPGIEDSNFYTLLFSLRMQGSRFYFPQGADIWLKAIRSPH